MKQTIQKILEVSLGVLGERYGNDALYDIASSISIERPKSTEHGDWTTNIAFELARYLRRSPHQIAQEIAQIFNDYDATEGMRAVAAQGYVNITIPDALYGNLLEEVIRAGERYGTNTIGKGKTVIVEYSSPNIAKPFTIGHFRSTIIGDAIARIMTANGYVVVRDNHLGDWGTQFGKLLYAITTWGDEDAIAQSHSPVKELVALYVRFHEEAEKDPSYDDAARAWFARLERKDPFALALWRKCITWSQKEFDRIYERLGVVFDTTYGESFFQGKMQDVIADLEAKDLLKESEGARMIFFDDQALPPLMIVKSDGTTIYATRDLATDRYRKEKYNPDIIINEVGAEQSLYFRQIFAAEELLGYFGAGQRVHVAHGMFRFKDGKMSTRKGNVIWLDDVLDRSVVEAEKMGAPKELAEAVGIGALKFNDLKREAGRDVLFDWSEMLNIKGDSGPYMQYTYARCRSVITKAEARGIVAAASERDQSARDIERMIVQFGEVVERAAQEYAPHHIAQYLIGLARAFNAYYAQCPIIDERAPEQSAYRVLVVQAVSTVMENGLTLLGIDAPEKM